MKSLFMQCNFIRKIEHLDTLENLSQLCLSRNMLMKVEGLENLKKLGQLDLSFNVFSNSENEVEALKGLVECPSIHTLDL